MAWRLGATQLGHARWRGAIEATLHREFIDHFIFARSLMLGLASLVAVSLSWAVTRVGLMTLLQTAQSAREITAHRLSTRLPAVQGPPELDELAWSFKAMLGRTSGGLRRLSGARNAHPGQHLTMQPQVMLTQARTADHYRQVLLANIEEYERLPQLPQAE